MWSFFPSSIGPFADFRPTSENKKEEERLIVGYHSNGLH